MSAENKTVILFHPMSVRRIGTNSPPLGLILTAIHIYKSYRVVLIDQIVEPDWHTRLIEALGQDPVCLGVSAMTGQQIAGGIAVSKVAHKYGCRVVWGGGLIPSLMPEQTLAHPEVDYVVAGEGEEAFAELVRALDVGSDVRGIRGVWSKTDGDPHFGGARPFVDPDTLPEIPYHLVELKRYSVHGPFGATLSIYSSRGCPRRCSFCYNVSYHNSQWRPFSAKRILGEIRRVREMCPKIEHIALLDDSFFPDLERAREFAAGISEMEPRLTWSAFGTHVRDILRMDDEYLRFLKSTGLTDVVVGVEAVSEHIIKMIRKNFRLEQLLNANRRLAAFGIRPTYTFLSGIPGETDDDLRKAVEVMFQLKRDNPQAILGNVKPFIPYPGTELYNQVLKMGFKPPQRLEDWSRFVWGNYTEIDTPWVSKKRKKWLNDLYFYTVALNPEYTFVQSKLFSLLARITLPITSWRVRHLCFRAPVAARVMALVERRFL